jgi:ABC-type sugar transport system ATPase subunit
VASISLLHVSKTYANGHAAVRELTLEIADGELLVLLGPSGSGKSTVLRLVAGLEIPTSGQILIGGRDVTAVPPQRRDLAMVFQSYALYPHKSVRDNLAFGLRVRQTAPAEIDTRVGAAAAALGIDALLDRKPAQLSGGQRQRVALGRAIVREPKAFLLDEPLSNLDPLLRVATRTELGLLHRRLAATMVYVTHDQEEAMTLATRVAVMRDGAAEQIGSPLDVFRRPANTFVAGFIGSPAMNLWPSVCQRRGSAVRMTSAVGPMELELCAPDLPDIGDGADLLLGVRPHDIDLTTAADADATGSVEVVEPLGSVVLVHLRVGGRPDGFVRVVVPSDDPPAPGDQVRFRLRRDRLHLFDRATGRRLN